MTDGQAIFLPVTTSNTTKIQIRHPFAAKWLRWASITTSLIDVCQIIQNLKL
jgi:hypothetical protein